MNSLKQQLVDVDGATLEIFRGDMPLAIMPGDQLHDRLKAAFEEVTLFSQLTT